VLRDLHRRTQLPHLCLAGGCALNSVMNGKIRTQTPFTDVYIQPAAADSGTALGAALHAWHRVGGEQPRRTVMSNAFWGPQYADDAYRVLLSLRGAELSPFTLRKITDAAELCRWTSQCLAQGKVVGWFQGGMEWGPRALGNRSILADPRRADMRQHLNAKIKARELFRPFGASILEEALDEYFIGAAADAFMTQVYPVHPTKREVIPAITHVDGSGRLQAVGRQEPSLYRQLLETFTQLTGVPVLLNTSFNTHEPIVCTPSDALDCFLRTQMDALVLGPYTLDRSSPQNLDFGENLSLEKWSSHHG
jgi:carbamoyltransferase